MSRASGHLNRWRDHRERVQVTPLPVERSGMSLIEDRRAWAAEHIREMSGGLSVPRYGTRAWANLPDDNPLKLASVLRAAELWATDGDDLEIASMVTHSIEVGEPMLVNEEYEKFTHAIVQGIERAQAAYKARAEGGDKAAIAALERMNDKSWMREGGAYGEIMRERERQSSE